MFQAALGLLILSCCRGANSHRTSVDLTNLQSADSGLQEDSSALQEGWALFCSKGCRVIQHSGQRLPSIEQFDGLDVASVRFVYVYPYSADKGWSINVCALRTTAEDAVSWVTSLEDIRTATCRDVSLIHVKPDSLINIPEIADSGSDARFLFLGRPVNDLLGIYDTISKELGEVESTEPPSTLQAIGEGLLTAGQFIAMPVTEPVRWIFSLFVDLPCMTEPAKTTEDHFRERAPIFKASLQRQADIMADRDERLKTRRQQREAEGARRNREIGTKSEVLARLKTKVMAGLTSLDRSSAGCPIPRSLEALPALEALGHTISNIIFAALAKAMDARFPPSSGAASKLLGLVQNAVKSLADELNDSEAEVFKQLEKGISALTVAPKAPDQKKKIERLKQDLEKVQHALKEAVLANVRSAPWPKKFYVPVFAPAVGMAEELAEWMRNAEGSEIYHSAEYRKIKDEMLRYVFRLRDCSLAVVTQSGLVEIASDASKRLEARVAALHTVSDSAQAASDLNAVLKRRMKSSARETTVTTRVAAGGQWNWILPSVWEDRFYDDIGSARLDVMVSDI